MKKLLSFLLVGVFLFGAEYGKITGKVTDAETGEPLIGADVIVEGTELGAATDERGEYVILYVPAGTYVVLSQYLGYDPYRYSQVVVNADQTTMLNFRLKPTVIEVERVTVVAERSPIVVSQVQTSQVVTSEDLSRLPVTTINQVVTLQAGVVQSDLGTSIRGGRSNEITYFVDGIVTKVPHTGAQSTQMSASSIEEVTVVSGGFEAEYGDALSGVINVVTKEGGAKPSGSLRFLSDAMFFPEAVKRKLNYGYNLFDISLGGPVPMAQRFRYFLSGELTTTNSYLDGLYQVNAPNDIYRIQGRFTFLMPNGKGKVTASGFNSRSQYMSWASASLKYFKNMPMSRTKNTIWSGTFNYMLSAKTLAAVKLGYTHYDRVFGNRDYQWEKDSGYTDLISDYRLYAEHLIRYLNDNSLPAKDVIVDSVMAYHEEYTNRDVEAQRTNPYGIEGLFYTYGDYRVWRYWQNNDIQGRFDISHAIGKIHEFKTGFDIIRYDMQFYENTLPWVTNPFLDYYSRKPSKFAYYAQDKMDFEGLIAKIGIRFDYFDPATFTYAVPNDPRDSTISRADVNYKISPRLGFSLPVTDRMKLRFNYGHYFQVPNLDDMYGVTDTAVVRLATSRGNTVIGNIYMKPMKTVMYEVGFEDQLSTELVFGFTAYFKDIYDLTTIREVLALPMSYFQFFNVDYGNVKGFEFRLNKVMSNMWSLGLNYTLQFAKGTSSDAWQFYSDYYDSGIDPITGLPLQPPVIDYWLDFDERHMANVNLDLELPSDFFLIPLQNVTSSFVLSFHSGMPYTPKDLKGNKLGDDNSARMPGWWNVDWSASKRFAVGPLKLVLSALIQNLFNNKQITNVYETTGNPDNHGDYEPPVTQFGYLYLTAYRYSPQTDYNHDGIVSPTEMKKAFIDARSDYYLDPLNYNGPFKVQLGLGIRF